MHVALIAGLCCTLLVAACSGTKPSSPGTGSPGAGKALEPAATPTSAQSAAPTVAVTPSGVVAPQPTNRPAAPAVVANQDAGKTVSPAAKAPAAAAKSTVTPPAAKAPAAAAKSTVAPPAGKGAAPSVAKSTAPTLDLASLTQRLKDSSAIGVLTKITLKNQVDDLLDQFRAFYQGKLKTTLAELRRPYDLLVLKVLSLLQDSDPSLASAIVASREAIWGILADPKKFATVS